MQMFKTMKHEINCLNKQVYIHFQNWRAIVPQILFFFFFFGKVSVLVYQRNNKVNEMHT